MQQPSYSGRSPHVVHEGLPRGPYENLKGRNALRREHCFSKIDGHVGCFSETCGASEPTDEELVEGLAGAMDSAADRNTDDDDMPSWEDPISVFFSVTKPNIDTEVYVKRLVKYAQCSKPCFIVVLIYLKRLEEVNEKLGVTYYNMHRLLITSLMLAAKMLDDRCFSNAHYMRVGGIATVPEVNRLEIQMLKLLDYRLLVSPEEYFEVFQQLRHRCIPQFRTNDIHDPELHLGQVTNARRIRIQPSPWTMIEEAPSGPILNERAPVSSNAHRIYQFDAPGHGYQVLPLVFETRTNGSPFGYRCPGVRSRVYR